MDTPHVIQENWTHFLSKNILPVQKMIALVLPPQNSSEQRGVEALGRCQPPLHLRDGDLVLGRRAEQGQPAGDGAEYVVRDEHLAGQHLLVVVAGVTLVLLLVRVVGLLVRLLVWMVLVVNAVVLVVGLHVGLRGVCP